MLFSLDIAFSLCSVLDRPRVSFVVVDDDAGQCFKTYAGVRGRCR